MTTDIYVLDASVAAKWYLDDEDHADAADLYLIQMLKGEIEFHAPVVLQYEIGHLITKAQRQSRRTFDVQRAQAAYQAFCELPITLVSGKMQ